jgi:hypothetical protein
MLETEKTYRGGCLCGALRYQADGRPRNMGLCYCADCRKASGSGYIPFMGFPASAVHFTGKTAQFDIEHTIYAGTLDDPRSSYPSSRSSRATACRGPCFRTG